MVIPAVSILVLIQTAGPDSFGVENKDRPIVSWIAGLRDSVYASTTTTPRLGSRKKMTPPSHEGTLS